MCLNSAVIRCATIAGKEQTLQDVTAALTGATRGLSEHCLGRRSPHRAMVPNAQSTLDCLMLN